jgi:hypothetical protein
MRDLTLETHRALNGDGAAVDTPPSDPDEAALQQMRSRHRVVQRDRGIAEMAVLMIETARMVEPVVAMIGSRVLRCAVLGISAWLTFYSVTHAATSWERGALIGGFMVLGSLTWWKL